jgi:hypothetical protein
MNVESASSKIFEKKHCIHVYRVVDLRGGSYPKIRFLEGQGSDHVVLIVAI